MALMRRLAGWLAGWLADDDMDRFHRYSALDKPSQVRSVHGRSHGMVRGTASGVAFEEKPQRPTLSSLTC